ncbi:phosphotransferase family protein [Exiguobacterium flavidum]|uniref:phosphotransferase family protein n=1 Tax=Exiguobacterium flavidum TaxID=2184695 RepID=UPI000DF81B67|nr:phosphotransferase [Exiguobacterium flavidum]
MDWVMERLEGRGVAGLTRLTGGYTNAAYVTKGETPFVVKVGRDKETLAREAVVLKQLKETGIAPRLLDTIETEQALLVLMEFREGENAQKLLDTGFPAMSTIYFLLGKALASIHQVKCELPKGESCDFNQLDFLDRQLADEASTWARDAGQEEAVLIHGDYGIHNALFDGNQVTILDWEWAESGSRYGDIAWVCWFAGLHYPEQAIRFGRVFLQGYQAVHPLHMSADLLKAHAVERVGRVLGRIAPDAIDARKEWERRLEWTLSTDLFERIIPGE